MTTPHHHPRRLRDLAELIADALVDEVAAPMVTKAAGSRDLTIAERAAARARVIALLRPLDHRLTAQDAQLDQLQRAVADLWRVADGPTTTDRLRALLAGDHDDDPRDRRYGP